MAIFNTKKILYASTSLIPQMANRIQKEFEFEGYDVTMDELSSGGYDISIAKVNIFKAVLGMRTAMKITLIPNDGNIHFEAGIGIWGQQIIPTIISMFMYLPTIFAQMWGIVEQSKLDDKALEIVNSVIAMNSTTIISTVTTTTTTTPPAKNIGFRFCTSCGTKNPENTDFCSNCGKEM